MTGGDVYLSHIPFVSASIRPIGTETSAAVIGLQKNDCDAVAVLAQFRGSQILLADPTPHLEGTLEIAAAGDPHRGRHPVSRQN